MPKKTLIEAVLSYGRFHHDRRARIAELRSGELDPIFDDINYRMFKLLTDAGKPVPVATAKQVLWLIEATPTPESEAKMAVASEVEWRSVCNGQDGKSKPLPELFEEVADDMGISSSTVRDCYYEVFDDHAQREQQKVLRTPELRADFLKKASRMLEKQFGIRLGNIDV